VFDAVPSDAPDEGERRPPPPVVIGVGADAAVVGLDVLECGGRLEAADERAVGVVEPGARADVSFLPAPAEQDGVAFEPLDVLDFRPVDLPVAAGAEGKVGGLEVEQAAGGKKIWLDGAGRCNC
jgi:hypothetical protein